MDPNLDGSPAETDEPAAHRLAEARRSDLRRASRLKKRARLIAVLPWAVAAVFAAVCAAAATIFLGSYGNAVVPALPPLPSGPRLVVERTFPSVATTLSQPTGLALSGDRLYVADPVRKLVDVYTRDGSHVATIGAGELQAPVYVAVGPVDGRVYVVDRGLETIEVFASDGTHFGALNPEGLEAGESTPTAWRPLGLAFGLDGTLYVADSSDDAHVAVFSPVGSRVGTLGADVPPGRSGRPLAFPNGIAITADQVILADSNNGRIVYLTRAGVYLRSLAVDGMPRGIASLADGGLLASDAASGKLAVYGPDGEVRASLDRSGEPGTSLDSPAGVAVDRDGTIFVADSGTGEIAVLAETSTPLPPAGAAPSSGAWLLAVAAVCGILAIAAVSFGVSRALMRTRARASAL